MADKRSIPEELEQKIDDYIQEKLTGEEIDELWAELIRDEEYIDYLESAANLKALIRQKKRRSGSGVLYLIQNHRNRIVAAAAALLLIAGSFAIYQQVTFVETVEPIAAIELDYYRSGDGAADQDESDEVIREAIVLVNSGNYDDAIRLLDEAIEQTEDPLLYATLQINAGSIMYNTGNYREGLVRFQHIIEHVEGDSVIRERAFWYIGNTHFQLNQMEEAREAFRKAYELNGAYSRIAQSYLRALAP